MYSAVRDSLMGTMASSVSALSFTVNCSPFYGLRFQCLYQISVFRICSVRSHLIVSGGQPYGRVALCSGDVHILVIIVVGVLVLFGLFLVSHFEAFNRCRFLVNKLITVMSASFIWLNRYSPGARVLSPSLISLNLTIPRVTVFTVNAFFLQAVLNYGKFIIFFYRTCQQFFIEFVVQVVSYYFVSTGQ